MGLSFGGLFGGGNQSTSAANTTSNIDSSQRNALTTQTGNPVLGSNNIVNDSGLVSLGIQNNNIAASVLDNINRTNAAVIGKLADVVKTTSNDVLNTAVSNNATATQVAGQTGALVDTIGQKLQNYGAIAAFAIGGYYFLFKGKK